MSGLVPVVSFLAFAIFRVSLASVEAIVIIEIIRIVTSLVVFVGLVLAILSALLAVVVAGRIETMMGMGTVGLHVSGEIVIGSLFAHVLAVVVVVAERIETV